MARSRPPNSAVTLSVTPARTPVRAGPESHRSFMFAAVREVPGEWRPVRRAARGGPRRRGDKRGEWGRYGQSISAGPGWAHLWAWTTSGSRGPASGGCEGEGHAGREARPGAGAPGGQGLDGADAACGAGDAGGASRAGGAGAACGASGGGGGEGGGAAGQPGDAGGDRLLGDAALPERVPVGPAGDRLQPLALATAAAARRPDPAALRLRRGLPLDLEPGAGREPAAHDRARAGGGDRRADGGAPRRGGRGRLRHALRRALDPLAAQGADRPGLPEDPVLSALPPSTPGRRRRPRTTNCSAP